MTFRLGLTGSIGMGKSTTAEMFADEGLPVWDADATVHRLYQPGQPAALAVGALFPTAIDPDGSVNRAALRTLIQTYFRHGGMQMQFNVTGRQVLEAARREPEKYRDLIVRVSGFSALYVQLGDEVQRDILARTEHGT